LGKSTKEKSNAADNHNWQTNVRKMPQQSKPSDFKKLADTEGDKDSRHSAPMKKHILW